MTNSVDVMPIAAIISWSVRACDSAVAAKAVLSAAPWYNGPESELGFKLADVLATSASGCKLVPGDVAWYAPYRRVAKERPLAAGDVKAGAARSDEPVV